MSTTTDKPNTTIVAIGPLCWGKGATQAIAIANAKKNKPSAMTVYPGKYEIGVYSVVNFVGVDGMGRIGTGPNGYVKQIGTASLIVRK